MTQITTHGDRSKEKEEPVGVHPRNDRLITDNELPWLSTNVNVKNSLIKRLL